MSHLYQDISREVRLHNDPSFGECGEGVRFPLMTGLTGVTTEMDGNLFTRKSNKSNYHNKIAHLYDLE